MKVYYEFGVLTLPQSAINDMTTPGPVDSAVAYWAPRIRRPRAATPEALAAYLKEFGAWDAEDLADDEANWRRVVWIAAGDAKELLAWA